MIKEKTLTIGSAIKQRTDKASPLDHPGIPYIGLDNVEAHTTKLIGYKDSASMKSSAKVFKKGDLLYSRLRPYLNKVWLADRDGLCSAEFIILPPNEFIDGEFLKYRISARDFVQFANSLNAGDRPRVDFKGISSFLLPPFSLSYQRSVVARIEELFSELDAGEQSLRDARQQLTLYRQSLLKQAFEGKLTETWRANNPDKLEDPKTLLSRIQQERESRYQQQLQTWQQAVEQWEENGKESKKPSKPRKADLSVATELNKNAREIIPTSWALCQIKDLIAELTDYHANGGYKILKEHVTLKDEPDYALMVRATNFEKNNFTNDQKYIPESSYNFLRKTKLYGGEILVGKIGNAGKVYLMPKLNRPASLAMNLFCLRFSEVDSFFIYLQLTSLPSEKEIKSYVKGVGNPTIDKKSLRSIHINLPSLPEQQEIIRLLDEQFTAIEQNEKEITHSLTQSQALRQSILKKAFEGKLI